MRIITFAIFGAAVCLAQQAFSAGRAIEGTLTGDDGTVLAGGSVFLQREQPYPPTSRATRWSTMSDAKGVFRFDNLADGRYSLCGDLPGSVWLNPCQWGKRPAPFSVPARNQITKAALVMVKGATVPIRIDDPGQLLPLHEGKTAGAHLLIGTGTDSIVFVPATRTSQDANGRSFEALIPVGVPTKLVVSSGFFQLSDSAGIPLARIGSTQIPVEALTGRTPATVRLIVTGGAK